MSKGKSLLLIQVRCIGSMSIHYGQILVDAVSLFWRRAITDIENEECQYPSCINKATRTQAKHRNGWYANSIANLEISNQETESTIELLTRIGPGNPGNHIGYRMWRIRTRREKMQDKMTCEHESMSIASEDLHSRNSAFAYHSHWGNIRYNWKRTGRSRGKSYITRKGRGNVTIDPIP